MGTRAYLRNARFSACLGLSLWIAAISAASASPWSRHDGELLVISRAEYFSAALVEEPGLFRRTETNTYFEYGLTSAITIGGKTIYGATWLETEDRIEGERGLSEVEGFGQFQFLRNNRQAGAVKLSVGKSGGIGSGARTSMQSQRPDAEIAALYGHNFAAGKLDLFAAAEAGYRRRFGVAADFVRLQATLGAKPAERMTILLEGYAAVSVRNEDLGGADFDIVKLQPSLIYHAGKRWSIQVGMNEEILGRNLALGRTFFIGVWSTF